MKKISRLSGLATIAAIVVGLVVLPVARADSSTMDDAHVTRIRSNCYSALSTLNRLHESDALLRVNRGQLYESISVKLMAALNSRVALNQLDGSKLAQVAVSYNKTLNTFRTDYQVYEEQVSTALKIDCTKQPIAFYDAVTDARTKRDAVHDSVLTLNQEIIDYSNAFNQFSAAYQAASKETQKQ